MKITNLAAGPQLTFGDLQCFDMYVKDNDKSLYQKLNDYRHRSNAVNHSTSQSARESVTTPVYVCEVEIIIHSVSGRVTGPVTVPTKRRRGRPRKTETKE